jgi:hypothetical protein
MGSERFLTASELAERLSVPVTTIYRWNYRGEGPWRVRVGKQRPGAQTTSGWPGQVGEEAKEITVSIPQRTGPALSAAGYACDWCGPHGSVAVWELTRTEGGPLETHRRCACEDHLDAALEVIGDGGRALTARRLCRATGRRPR